MRYILNFNHVASELLMGKTSIDLSSAPRNSHGASVLVRGTYDDSPALAPKGDGSDISKARISEDTARSVGLRGSQRYTMVRRGKGDSFYLVPHSQVRRSARRRIEGPAVTVSITERP